MSLEYFNAYHSYIEAMEPLNDAERGRLFTACLLYSRTGEALKLRGNERFVFPGMKSQIDRDKQAYAKRCEINRQNGRRALAARDGHPPTSPDCPPMPPKEKEKAKEKTKEKETETAKEKTEKITKAKETAQAWERALDINAEPKNGSTPEDSPAPKDNPAPETVISLPLNDKSEYAVNVEQCQEWAGLYPAVDVIQQLREMRGWLLANPARRKTRQGILRFITSWLAREQDRGGRGPAGPPGQEGRGSWARLAAQLDAEEMG